MRPAIVVFGAISAIEVALVRYIKTALQRFAITETLRRFQDVVAGKFATDFTEKLHAMIERANSLRELAPEAIVPGGPSRNTRDLLLGPITRHSSARSNRKRICLSGNHGRSNL